jgi:hypothetical protein
LGKARGSEENPGAWVLLFVETNMKRALGLILLASSLAAPRLSLADDVILTNGGRIENVKAAREGDRYHLVRAAGSSWLPADEVARVEVKELPWEELAEKKRAAGDDPVALRELARWCDEQKLHDEHDNLLALARGIELDRKLETLEDEKTAAPFLALHTKMMTDGGYSDAELHAVLDRALAVEPENAEVRARLGQAKRDGRWITFAEAVALDDAREAACMKAKGYVKFEGTWMTPAAVSDLLAERERARTCAEPTDSTVVALSPESCAPAPPCAPSCAPPTCSPAPCQPAVLYVSGDNYYRPHRVVVVRPPAPVSRPVVSRPVTPVSRPAPSFPSAPSYTRTPPPMSAPSARSFSPAPTSFARPR